MTVSDDDHPTNVPDELPAGRKPARGYERKTGKTRAVVLVPVFQRRSRSGSRDQAEPAPSVHSPEDRLAEAKGLAEAIDLDVRRALVVPVAAPRPGTLFGKGKLDEIKAIVEAEEAELAIVDHAVSPVQQRNLERAWSCKVLDRTGLILEIFGQRARTREGRLQVELAHLTYQKSRLVRSWTHLERQRGGAGFLGGPGETQLELDRRLIQDRIDAINEELEVVVRTRELHRAGRRRVPYPVAAIVGYTNAGKSTLFNTLTGAAVLAKDQVFATLDPTMREIRLPGGRRIILSDTVGFISDLPTMLVAAFRATLEEVIEADLILHVRDISHQEREAQRADVEQVLRDLGITVTGPEAHILEVWNKIDRLDPIARDELAHMAARRNESRPVLVSAVTGEGLPDLLLAIDARLSTNDEIVTIIVPASDGKLLHWLHENTEVIERGSGESGAMTYRVRIDKTKRGRLENQLKRAGIGLPAE
jgi:GTP-binding protein HflX